MTPLRQPAIEGLEVLQSLKSTEGRCCIPPQPMRSPLQNCPQPQEGCVCHHKVVGLGGAARPRQKNELQKNTKKVSEMHRKQPRAGVLSPHPLCRQKVLSSASSSAGKGEVGGKKKEGVTPPAPRHVSVQGGVSAPAPRARGSGRCRCTRGGPSCSAPAAPPAGRCPRRHPPGGRFGWGCRPGRR